METKSDEVSQSDESTLVNYDLPTDFSKIVVEELPVPVILLLQISQGNISPIKLILSEKRVDIC